MEAVAKAAVSYRSVILSEERSDESKDPYSRLTLCVVYLIIVRVESLSEKRKAKGERRRAVTAAFSGDTRQTRIRDSQGRVR